MGNFISAWRKRRRRRREKKHVVCVGEGTKRRM